MIDLNASDVLVLLAAICFLLSFFSNGKAVWAGLLFGIIMATIAEVFSLVFAKGFYWPMAEKIIGLSVLTGFLFDLVYKLIKRAHKS